MRRTAMMLILAVVALAAPWSVTVAHAGTDNVVASSGRANYVHFRSYGDDLLNCDARADGHHAVVQWVDGRNPGLVRTHRNTAGSGTCRNALAGVNLREGSGITFHSCIGEGRRIYGCSGPVNGIA